MNHGVRKIKNPDPGSVSASEKQRANEDTAQAKANCCGTIHTKQ
jgi:hypothetical protein